MRAEKGVHLSRVKYVRSTKDLSDERGKVLASVGQAGWACDVAGQGLDGGEGL